jgi:chitinase/chitodextrinase
MKVFDSSTGRIPTFILDPSTGMNEDTFKSQIKQINQQGRAVLIALGGADAHIELYKGDESALANEIIRLVETYGLDGLDIDLEQSAIIAGDNQIVIPEALKIVKDHYKSQGKNFMITMAPEFPYLRVGNNYVPYIQKLEEYYDYINPQFYNQGGDGVWVDEENLWITQNDDNLKEKFIYYMMDSFDNGSRGFIQIPAEKIVFGIPSNIDAAATGYIKDPNALFNAFNKLKSEGRKAKGIMTWSINWDLGKNNLGTPYNKSFVNTYAPFLFGQSTNTPPIIKGCNNVQILIGSVFDSKKGVTAIDKEDGDISSKIKIEGTVDTQKIGTYTLTYSVVDLGNLTTKVIRTVQVIAAQFPSIDFEKPVNNSTIFINLGDTVPIKLKITDPSSLLTDIKIAVDGKDFSGIIANWIPSKFGTYVITGSANNKDAVIKSQITVIISQKSTSDCNGIPAWDSSKTYSINETQVSYKGNIYKNQWWTSGETPGVAAVWKFVNYCTGGGPDLTETCGYEKWSSDKTYENPGINIYYNEKIYKNQWWTSGETPGINAVWVFVKNCVTPNSSNMQENTSVKIHPNPVNDFITIVTDKNILEVGVYELSSIKVKSFKGNKVIDVHNLKQGYYILKITFNDNSNQSINFYKK